jgi:hypothetical protein
VINPRRQQERRTILNRTALRLADAIRLTESDGGMFFGQIRFALGGDDYISQTVILHQITATPSFHCMLLHEKNR